MGSHTSFGTALRRAEETQRRLGVSIFRRSLINNGRYWGWLEEVDWFATLKRAYYQGIEFWPEKGLPALRSGHARETQKSPAGFDSPSLVHSIHYIAREGFLMRLVNSVKKKRNQCVYIKYILTLFCFTREVKPPPAPLNRGRSSVSGYLIPAGEEPWNLAVISSP